MENTIIITAKVVLTALAVAPILISVILAVAL